MLKLMQGWLIECYPDHEDEILESTVERVERAVDKLYEGGLRQFIIDATITGVKR